jgi:DNA polymerase elongation subunit (family B)
MHFYTSVERLGDTIFCTSYENGSKKKERINYKPTLFFPSKDKKETDWKDIKGNFIEPVKFSSMSEASNFTRRYNNIDNFSYCGMETYLYQFTSEMFPGKIEFDAKQIRIGYLDIETDYDPGVFPDPWKAAKEVTAISFHVKDTFYVFGLKPYKVKQSNVKYFQFKTEISMLEAFVRLWQKLDIDIVTGWNLEWFDIPYIINRVRKLLGEEYVKMLSPWGIIKKKTVPTMNGVEQESYDIYGISVLDYYLLYRKFSNTSLENYKLDTVADEVLNERKIDYKTLGYKDLRDLYDKNPDLYIDYNIQDTGLLLKLEKKTKILNLVMTLAYMNKVAYIDVFKQTRMWDSFIYDYLKQKNIIIPRKNPEPKYDQFLGAYVKEPVPGIYEWVVTFDVSSLYPSLFMGYNVGPDTFVGKIQNSDTLEFVNSLIDAAINPYLDMIKEKNLSMASNGTLYRKDIKGFAAEILQVLFDERQKFKKMQLAAEDKLVQNKDTLTAEEIADLEEQIATYGIKQTVMKVCANSFYGSFGSPGFRFFEVDQAEAITASGQHAIRYAERRLNEFMRKLVGASDDVDFVIFSDTDSLGVTFKPVLEKMGIDPSDKEKCLKIIDKLSQERVQPFLDKIFRELYENQNAYEHKISMKREKTANIGIWPSGKKRYILNVLEKEGIRYKEPKVMITGAEAVRSTTPKICKESLKEIYRMVLNDTEKNTRNYINQFSEKFLASDPSAIAIPKGVSDIDKYYDKTTLYKSGCPIHVRASLLHNELVKKLKLTGKYQLIGNGSKIKYLYLRLPNPIGENVIGFNDELPPEFGLDKYIDRELQLDKAFLNALDNLFDARQWQIKEEWTLEKFFVEED